MVSPSIGESVTHSAIVTYSPSYTLVPTYECFNRCQYCNFRVDPGQDVWRSLEQATAILQSLQSSEVIEILILSGEVAPHSPRRATWFQRIYDLCQLAASLGFLPHTNAGILTLAEMAALKTVNVSMGLMLEQMTLTLRQTVHRHAPSKLPTVRLQQLQWAGELRIPFTTGLLFGIGETDADWVETLETIAQVHQQWGHIQEVILQPYRQGTHQAGQQADDRSIAIESVLQLVQLAQRILPSEIVIQIPPNLVATPEHLLACIAAGGRDLGGISPRDEVNPDYPHPAPTDLATILHPAGWQLQPRLPLYPRYDDWLSPALRAAVTTWRTNLQRAQPWSGSRPLVVNPAGGTREVAHRSPSDRS